VWLVDIVGPLCLFYTLGRQLLRSKLDAYIDGWGILTDNCLPFVACDLLSGFKSSCPILLFLISRVSSFASFYDLNPPICRGYQRDFKYGFWTYFIPSRVSSLPYPLAVFRNWSESEKYLVVIIVWSENLDEWRLDIS
jgi:hypothetical protein